MKHHHALLLFFFSVASATAATTTYNLDPDHTHPSFEVDHFGGLSTWRGTFKKSSGTVTLDTEAKTGTVDVIIDTATVDLAHDKLNEHVSSPEMLDVTKFPTAEYKGQFVEFANGAPRTISGNLTLHGVTKPVTLTINSFKCFEHPMLKKQVCGADASGSFNRAEFGVNYGQQYGFKQDVLLRIQVEGIKAN
jgi:polyisoprenoid-binding protein YceI